MTAPALIAALLLFCGSALAAPRPNIPPAELPGHERDRFIDPFPKPKSAEPPLIVSPKPAKRPCRDTRRSKSRKKC